MATPAPLPPPEHTKHQGLSTECRDKTSPVWDMSQERAFNEQLLNQRFSFFVVFFGLCIAGALNAKSQLHFQLVLSIGAVVTFLFALVLNRTQKKVDLVIEDLFTDATHPITIIENKCGPGSKRKILGHHIPVLCCGLLFVGALFAWTGCLRYASGTSAPQAGVESHGPSSHQ